MKLALNSETALSWLGGIVLAAVSLLTLIVLSDTIADARLVMIAGLLLAQLLSYLAALSRWADVERNRALVLFWLQAALILTLYTQVDLGFIAILGIVWVVQAAELYSVRTTITLMLGAVGAFTLAQIMLWPGQLSAALTNAITLSLFHVFAVVLIHRFHSERALREQTAALNRELLATRELLSQQSRQTERLRIARDLHDLLGHHMTALILQLEVATHVTEGKGKEKVEQSLALAKLLLSDLRSAVSDLREDDAINLDQAIQKLISDIPDLSINLDMTSAPVVRETRIAETLLRCTQEALTNVLRHSNATQCDITLSLLYNQYFLAVQDNGKGAVSLEPGNGLKGMRERVAEFGGEVTWEQQYDGFLLQVKVPVEDTQ